MMLGNMRRAVGRAGCLGPLLALSGCMTTDSGGPMSPAEERELIDEVQAVVDRAGKIHELTFPILTANVDVCGERVRPTIGATWITEADLDGWPTRRRVVAKAHFGIGQRPVLDDVVDGGPAAAAGLRRWDTISSIDGNAVPQGGRRSEVAEILESAAGDGRIEFAYERDGETALAEVTPVMACDVRVVLVDDGEPTAFVDGHDIYVTTGLYLTEAEAALQAVVAHQLAHIVAGHVRAQKARRAVGASVDVGVTVAVNVLMMLGAAAAAAGGDDIGSDLPFFSTGGFFSEMAGRMFTHRNEREADDLSLPMLERAGVSVSDAVGFWRDLAAEPGDLAAFVEKHPVNDERLDHLDATLARIEDGPVSIEPPVAEK
ncbi:MAG: M48 family metalloprotease [Gammaproteobacteria bacterium]|nr:M48 family metalloprotease [Gammaproteobacteria bacterium]